MTNVLSPVARAAVLVLALTSTVVASDHADPIDLTRMRPLEPVITDLFVFPVDVKGKVVAPFEVTDGIPLHPRRDPNKGLPMRPEMTPEERKSIKSLVAILCVRRMLTQTKSLNLEPYRYQLHMDSSSAVSFEDTSADVMAREARKMEAGMGYRPSTGMKGERPTGEEARERYGGKIGRPDKIEDNVIIELTLRNDASLNTFRVTGLAAEDFDRSGVWNPEVISVWTGVRDDPFIFPPFFGTNVVAMVVSIPMHYFESDQSSWLVWATSHKGGRQIDHVGRSLRTQNPRFELLNTLHPREHVKALTEENENPGLMRDLAVRINLQQLAAYRPWDFVPDVMIFTPRFRVGYPNGRLLTDDVAALLAQNGDTLLLELSHQSASWPRATTNDKTFSETFPYLAEPWDDKPPTPPPELSARNTMILLGVLLVVAVILVLAALQVVSIVRRLLGIRKRPNPL